MSRKSRRFEVLLPVQFNDGREVPPEWIAEAVLEIVDHTYFNCDLPSVEAAVRDPQVFFRSQVKPIVVFDEVHQLRNPARLLKIGADLFPKLKILATGSSTLAATKKFRDTLAGRKRGWKSPMPRRWSVPFTAADVRNS